jgi:hypothetical protein
MRSTMALGLTTAAAVALLASTAGAQGAKPLKKCPADAVIAGTVCMDTYEASVWRVPDPLGANKGLVKRIQLGKITEAATMVAAGATQVGLSAGDWAPCDDAGRTCTNDVYALSLPGVLPSIGTWFQAQQACKNSRKRLPSNAEWQAAVAGTPDPDPMVLTATDCAPLVGVVPTGSRADCVSADGAFDMVGNVREYVADWVPRSTGCGSWSGGLGDEQCLAGAAETGEPGAVQRGARSRERPSSSA